MRHYLLKILKKRCLYFDHWNQNGVRGLPRRRQTAGQRHIAICPNLRRFPHSHARRRRLGYQQRSFIEARWHRNLVDIDWDFFRGGQKTNQVRLCGLPLLKSQDDAKSKKRSLKIMLHIWLNAKTRILYKIYLVVCQNVQGGTAAPHNNLPQFAAISTFTRSPWQNVQSTKPANHRLKYA